MSGEWAFTADGEAGPKDIQAALEKEYKNPTYFGEPVKYLTLAEYLKRFGPLKEIAK